MTSSTEIHTGDIGEALCYYRLLQMGVPCRIVNLGSTDIIAILDDEIQVRIQVKSAHRSYEKRYKNPTCYYGFNVCRGSKVKRSFEEHECDVFACVGIDDGNIMFFPSKKIAGMKTKKLKACLFEDENVTQDTWNKAIRPLLYT